jgi:hypothetical protein
MCRQITNTGTFLRNTRYTGPCLDMYFSPGVEDLKEDHRVEAGLHRCLLPPHTSKSQLCFQNTHTWQTTSPNQQGYLTILIAWKRIPTTIFVKYVDILSKHFEILNRLF